MGLAEGDNLPQKRGECERREVCPGALLRGKTLESGEQACKKNVWTYGTSIQPLACKMRALTSELHDFVPCIAIINYILH